MDSNHNQKELFKLLMINKLSFSLITFNKLLKLKTYFIYKSNYQTVKIKKIYKMLNQFESFL